MSAKGRVTRKPVRPAVPLAPVEFMATAASVGPAPAIGTAAPATSPAAFPIVGIGASAGGLAAFEAFFSGMPTAADPGMAFVLVQHLAPDHKSILTELIRRYTRMQVFEVENGMVVQPNCAYIIPPNRDMAFLNGALQLLEPAAPRGQRLPIDFFFRSLAQDQHERAIGIVLSGTGSDGTLGVRAIKGEGGMAMAQTPATTDYNGMPSSAIATGLVDFVLPPVEMPAQLVAYARHAFAKAPPAAGTAPAKVENALQAIFVLLRSQTRHDFSHYKLSTIRRRIDRRLAVHQIATLGDYVKYLRETPGEVEALFRDLLIGVTQFFRDPEAFAVIEEWVVPKLFAGKRADAVIRVWVPGCSTGEEAYSLAILLAERQEVLKQGFRIQVFATDIDGRAIATARAGVYPASIAADLTPERLARFFATDPEHSSYRIHKSIRDLLVFSEQNATSDPPFSKIDLISCRNLLIYLDGDLQRLLMPRFHYALNPDGFLFLGTSESVGDFNELFTALDRKAKLYQRQEAWRGGALPAVADFLPTATALQVACPRGGTALPAKLPLRALVEQALLQEVGLAAALADRHGDVLYLHGRTGMYLEPTPGEVGVSNVLKMAREGLREELSMALRLAVDSRQVVRRPGLWVKTNGDFTLVNLTVRPLPTVAAAPETSLYLVILGEAPPAPSLPTGPASAGHEGAPGEALAADSRLAELQQELRAKGEYLQSANEELETANEELKSANEEMQSVNEELQSSNEELETSKEELQSVNEELATVNGELQGKVADLSRANNDMSNMLAGTWIATVFVDHRQRILRFTPASTRIINLILSDVGRPLGHTVSNLVGYDCLVADTQEVLDTLVPRTVDVRTKDGLWYALRIQPYRTLENVIEGAVITFADITEVVRVREALRQANDLLRLAVVVRDAHDAITVQDFNGRILAWNPGAVRIYGWSEAEALAMSVRDRIPPGRAAIQALTVVQQLATAHEALDPYRTQRLAKDGSVKEVWLTATALLDEQRTVYAIATTERLVNTEDPAEQGTAEGGSDAHA